LDPLVNVDISGATLTINDYNVKMLADNKKDIRAGIPVVTFNGGGGAGITGTGPYDFPIDEAEFISAGELPTTDGKLFLNLELTYSAFGNYTVPPTTGGELTLWTIRNGLTSNKDVQTDPTSDEILGGSFPVTIGRGSSEKTTTFGVPRF
jgi:hypothetical protein